MADIPVGVGMRYEPDMLCPVLQRFDGGLGGHLSNDGRMGTSPNPYPYFQLVKERHQGVSSC